ncbi:hypothetical protein QQ045_009757 [Rhodiola kirilowii]
MSEDVQLYISYCRQSVDPIFGAKQKVDKLWEKVHTDFKANWVMGEAEIITTDSRSQSALQSRFAKLKPNLVLWGSCISYAIRNPESGCNLQDEEETKIMQMNTDVITPKSKRYFLKRKAAILRGYEDDEASNDQDAFGNYSDCYCPTF